MQQIDTTCTRIKQILTPRNVYFRNGKLKTKL